MYRRYLTIYTDNLAGTDNLKTLPKHSINSTSSAINAVNFANQNQNISQPNISQESMPPNDFTVIQRIDRVPSNGTILPHSYSNDISRLQRALQTDSGDCYSAADVTQVKQYEMREQLGNGSYGLVQLAYNKENSTYYAMKSLSKKKLMKSYGLFNRHVPLRKSVSTDSSLELKSFQPGIDPLQKIYKEIAIHKKLNHPNIVKLIDVLDDPSESSLYMVFEYVENGAIMQIGKDDPFPEERARKYFIDALLGLEYLHYQKIIHRDIKPANLLLSKQNRVKIADFGVSNEFAGEDIYLTSTAGSPAFMAPESLQSGERPFTGKALDIWALGITLYAFLFAKIPFEHCNRYLLYQMIVNNPITYPESHALSGEVIHLLNRMLDKDPQTRIKIPDIKTHDWITEFSTKLIPSEMENCGATCIDVTADEVANSIRQIPHIQTVIKIKTLLKHKSFRNPQTYNSVSKLNISDVAINEQCTTPQLPPGGGTIPPVIDDKHINETYDD